MGTLLVESEFGAQEGAPESLPSTKFPCAEHPFARRLVLLPTLYLLS